MEESEKFPGGNDHMTDQPKANLAPKSPETGRAELCTTQQTEGPIQKPQPTP